VMHEAICRAGCYVGKSRLERAISSFQGKPEGKDILFNVNWHPYQLNPNLPQVTGPNMIVFLNLRDTIR
jgi:predicted DsbA family dithiol-disulfide isomerase